MLELVRMYCSGKVYRRTEADSLVTLVMDIIRSGKPPHAPLKALYDVLECMGTQYVDWFDITRLPKRYDKADYALYVSQFSTCLSQSLRASQRRATLI